MTDPKQAKVERTPGPWGVALDTDGFTNIVSPNADGTLELMIAECYGPQAVQEANAAFICLAVNHHAELLALVERYAKDCRACSGRGFRMTHPAGSVGDCVECADIRALLSRVAGHE